MDDQCLLRSWAYLHGTLSSKEPISGKTRKLLDVGCFIFVLPSWVVVAEERKNRRHNSTRNHNIVYHGMTTIWLNFPQRLLIFIENLCLGTKVWPFFPCFKKLTTCASQLFSLVGITTSLGHIPFSTPPCLSPFSLILPKLFKCNE